MREPAKLTIDALLSRGGTVKRKLSGSKLSIIAVRHESHHTVVGIWRGMGLNPMMLGQKTNCTCACCFAHRSSFQAHCSVSVDNRCLHFRVAVVSALR